MYSRIKVLIVLISCMPFLCAKYGNLSQQPLWDDKLNFEEIEHRLKNEAVIHSKNMRSFMHKIHKTARFLHPVEIVTLESGLMAVVKKNGQCYGEIGAYNAAKTLGLRFVPPTVFRMYNGVPCSFQFYVNSKIDVIKTGLGVFKKVDPKTRADMALFSYLLNRWDKHSGNQLLSEHGGRYYPALIDNAGSTFITHKPRFRKRAINYSTYIALKLLTQEKLEEIWADYLPVAPSRVQTVIQRMLQRKELVLSSIGAENLILSK